MVKFRVTETSNSTFENAEGSLPFDIDGLGPEGATVRVQVWNTSAGSATVIPPYNILPPEIFGAPEVAQLLSLGGDAWDGAVGFNYWWYADGAEVATTSTYTVVSGDRSKTITAAKQAQGVGGSDPSVIIATSNSLFISSNIGDGTLVAGEYIFQEAVADADTRKTYVEIYDTPPSGYEWIIYRGTNPAGDLASVAVPTFDGTKSVWTSTGQAAVGTGPTARTTVYVRIGLRETAVPTNKYFVTPAGEYFLASSTPGAPYASLAQGAGQGEIYITIDTPADGAGRVITGYQYSLDAGVWSTLPGGTATGQRTVNTGVPTTTYSVRVRATNANGDGAATAAANVISGTVSVAPAAFGTADWSLTDKPSATGNTVTLAFTALPSNGGSAITDVQYQINAGSWVSIGTTPTSLDVTVPATTLVDMQIRAVNAIGSGATDTKSITPTTIAAASTTAYFGADTVANAGSWRPETTLGDEVTLTGIVSQTGMTRTWAVTGGALVCTNGTPAVDNTKTLTVSTASGNIVVTISTVANAWSVADATELRAALAATNASPATVYLRPRLYDLGNGSGSATPTGLGVFHVRTYTATNRRTVDKHPGQVKKPWSVDTGSNTRTTQYLTIKNFRFTVASTAFGRNNAVLYCDNANGGGVVKLYLDNCDFEAPSIPIEVLTDPTPWTTGYTGPTFTPLKLMGTTGAFRGTQITNCTFRNVWHAGDYTVREDFKFNNNMIDTYYFDGIRLFPQTSLWTGSSDTMPKEITGNTIINSFGRQNEIRNADGTATNAPHTDAQQIISGSISDCLWWKNIFAPGALRANQTSSMQTNGSVSRSIIGGVYMNGPDLPWGFNPPGGGYLVITGTWLHDNGGGTEIRISANTQNNAFGENLLKHLWCRNGNTSGFSQNGSNFAAIDAVRQVRDATVLTAAGTSITSNFNYTPRPPTIADVIATCTPKVGSAADTNGYGALTTSGAWRHDEWPPMHGEPPTLANAGADLLITPSVSKLAYATPTNWEYAYRNAVGAVWTEVGGLSGANATLLAPNKTGIEVMARWIGTNGLKGTWSRQQTVIV